MLVISWLFTHPAVIKTQYYSFVCTFLELFILFKLKTAACCGPKLIMRAVKVNKNSKVVDNNELKLKLCIAVPLYANLF